MSRATLEADMRDHPKWLSLSPLAYRLGVRLVLWAVQHSRGTGFVPEFVVREYAGTKTMAAKLAKELGECGKKFGRAGVLDTAEGGFVVHDLLTGDEPDGEPRRTLSKAEAGRLGGQASVEARKAASGSASPKQTAPASSGASASTGQAAPDLSLQDHSVSSSSGSESDPPLSPQPEPKPAPAASRRASDADAVFEFWREDTGHRGAVFDRKRRKRIEARLREGRTAEELKQAIRNRRLNRFLMGENDHGTVYDGIETLLRDASQVERLLAMSGAAPAGASVIQIPLPTPDAATARAKAAEVEARMKARREAERGAQ